MLAKKFFLLINTCGVKNSIGISNENILIDKIFFKNDASTVSEINLMIDDLFLKNKITFNDLKAVAISAGPGSYTGLRIAYSFAKAFCFTLNLPLIEINTLESWRNFYLKNHSVSLENIVPMMDARNENVYALKNNLIQFFELKLLENKNNFYNKNEIYIGKGAFVLKEIASQNQIDCEDGFDLEALVDMVFSHFENKIFSDIAYCEPLYIKSANITQSNKSIL